MLTYQKFIAFGFSLSICYGTSLGLGRHQEDVKLDWEHPLKKSEYAFSVLYVRPRCLRCRNPLTEAEPGIDGYEDVHMSVLPYVVEESKSFQMGNNMHARRCQRRGHGLDAAQHLPVPSDRSYF